MEKSGIMIGTCIFETIDEAYEALRKYGSIEGCCETYMIDLPERVFNNLLRRTQRKYPLGIVQLNFASTF